MEVRQLTEIVALLSRLFSLLTLTKGKAEKWREDGSTGQNLRLKPRRKRKVEKFSKYFPFLDVYLLISDLFSLKSFEYPFYHQQLPSSFTKYLKYVMVYTQLTLFVEFNF